MDGTTLTESHYSGLTIPLNFFQWLQLFQGLPENHLLHLNGEKMYSHRLLHTFVPLLPQRQQEGLSEPKASMVAFIFAVLTSSQQLTVFHPVCLMDLTGSKSWHLLQS